MTVVYIIIAIIAIPFIIALFIPKDYKVENFTIINKPKHEVFDYIKFVKNQEQYSKWVMSDPNVKTTLTGTDGTIGFIYAWEGPKAGAGEQEITGITDGDHITMEIRFIKPFKSIGHTYMETVAESEHSTKITWALSGKSNYPVNLMTALMKGTLKNDIGISLNNLKRILEK
jgi:hypothetical protein